MEVGPHALGCGGVDVGSVGVVDFVATVIGIGIVVVVSEVHHENMDNLADDT